MSLNMWLIKKFMQKIKNFVKWTLKDKFYNNHII